MPPQPPTTRKGPARPGSPLCRRHGSNLPSSLTRIRSIASVYSTRPPVSVWGTGGNGPRAEAFLGRRDHRISRHESAHHHASPHEAPGFAWGRGHTLDQGKPPPAGYPSASLLKRSTHARPGQTATESGGRSPHQPYRMALVHTGCWSVRKPVREYRPVHPFDYACRPRLRDPTHPGTTNVALEPLVFQRQGSSPCSRYSCLHSHSHTVHGRVPPPLRPGVGRSPTTRPYGRIRVFGGVLEPPYIVGAEPLDQ